MIPIFEYLYLIVKFQWNSIIYQSNENILTLLMKFIIWFRLKAVCERVICDNLDVSNAAQALVLAHLHEAKQLKKVAVDFVTQNIVKVSETPGWSQIVGGNEVLGDILKSVMLRLKQ